MDDILARVEEELRLRRYSPRTRLAYMGHIRRFLSSEPRGDVLDADRVRRYFAAQARRDLSRRLKTKP
jgi:hypothetical protein